tara:strand:- start:389 stop:3985 length:3597 start_codon:yes stop_codon:yes gene_type:complete
MPIATPQGTLDFKSVDKVTFVGASSNTVIDTTTGSLGVGVDGNGPTSKLHVVGNAFISSDLTVSGTGALTVPNGTTDQRPTAANGMIRYNSTTGFMEAYSGGVWAPIAQPPTVTGISPLSTLVSGGQAEGFYHRTEFIHPTPASGTYFGRAVALTSDGSRALVGAKIDSTGGTAHIFKRTGDTWAHEAELEHPNPLSGDNFSDTTAISEDGVYAFIGVPRDEPGAGGQNNGSVQIYVRNTTTNAWTWQAELLDNSPSGNTSTELPGCLSTNSDGTRVLVGIPKDDSGAISGATQQSWNDGTVQVFVRNTSTNAWTFEATLSEPNLGGTSVPHMGDYFGAVISLSSDGVYAAIAAPNDNHNSYDGGSGSQSARGKVFIFVRNTSTNAWSYVQTLVKQIGTYANSDRYGSSVDIDNDGSRVVIGCRGDDQSGAKADVGSAEIWKRIANGSWAYEAVLIGDNSDGNGDGTWDEFGASVAINSDGTRVIVSAPKDQFGVGNTQYSDLGSVQVFDRNTSTDAWTNKAVLFHPDAGPNGASDQMGEDLYSQGGGRGVALSADGKYILATVPNDTRTNAVEGSAQLFDLRSQVFDTSTQVFTATGTGIVSGSTVQLEGADGSLYSVVDATAPNAAGTQITFKMLKDNIMTPSEYDAVNTNSYSIYFEPNTPSPNQASGNYGNFLYDNGAGVNTNPYLQWSDNIPYVALAMAQMGSFGGGTPPNCPSTQLWIDKDINGTNTYKIVGIKSGQSLSSNTVANQPYKVRINSTSGLIGASTAVIGFPPTWTTAVGANLSFDTSQSTTQTLVGTDGGGGTNRTFSLAPGSNALPAKVGGGTLDLTTTLAGGAITGQIAANQDGITTSVTFRLTDNATGLFTDRAINIVGVSALYTFSPNPFTFTNAGQTGRLGPTLATLTGHADYSSAAWRTNTAYFNLGAPSPSPTSYPSRLNGFQLWTVPDNATYKIIAKGARGGSSIGTEDGYGGQIEARFTLTKGTKIIIVVGQRGGQPGSTTGGGGGGGATFILKDNFSVSSNYPYMGTDLSDIYMIVGGGGGGTSDYHSSSGRAGDAEMYSSGGAIGGTGAGSYGGGGGTGYTTTGGGMSSGIKSSGGGSLSSTTQFFGFPGGESWTSGSYGAAGSQDGGFGGGGAAVHHEGGAGGGYQGGSCGSYTSTNPDAGGHTFVSSTATYTGSHTTHTDQHGSVQITKM